VYLIDYETLEPTLENVMFNLMECDQMLFGSKRKFCITYKKNEANFEVRTRKYHNDFRILLEDHNFEASKGISISSVEVFIVSKDNCLFVYDSRNFQRIYEETLELKLIESDTKESNHIISIAMDENDMYLAILAGKSLIMGEQEPIQLFIYKINDIKKRSKKEALFTLEKHMRI
jgi:hypothetical protein